MHPRHRTHQATKIIPIAMLITACSAGIAGPTTTPTSTPVPPTATPEPTPTTLVYQNNESGVSFAYPNGWQQADWDNLITVANDDGFLAPFDEIHDSGIYRINIWANSLEQQAFGSPIALLHDYTVFRDIDMPDQEPAHSVFLNDKEFAIGTYSDDYVKSRPGAAVPIFLAAYFARQHTFLAEMYASTEEDESAIRMVFEDLLKTIESDLGTYASYDLTPSEPKIHLSADELNGWTEQDNNQKVDLDGVCRQFIHETLEDNVLLDCIYNNSIYGDTLRELREYARDNSDNTYIDLTSKSSHSYDHEFFIFAIEDDNDLPVYTLILEKDHLVFRIDLTTPRFVEGSAFEDEILGQFNQGPDDALHDVIIKNLEKVEYPFDPAILASVNDLENWESSTGDDRNRTAYNDSICSDFTSDIDYGYTDTLSWPLDILYNCVRHNTEGQSPASMKTPYKGDPGNKFIDLKTQSKYTYEYEFELFAYDSSGYSTPTYELHLERDGVIYSAMITTTELQSDVRFEDGALHQFSNGVDTLLHDVIALNLERNE